MLGVDIPRQLFIDVEESTRVDPCRWALKVKNESVSIYAVRDDGSFIYVTGDYLRSPTSRSVYLVAEGTTIHPKCVREQELLMEALKNIGKQLDKETDIIANKRLDEESTLVKSKNSLIKMFIKKK